MTYDELLIEADAAGTIVKELPLQSGDGRCRGNRIAIRENIPTLAKKADTLAEELGHYYTTVGDIVKCDTVDARKFEHQARMIAYGKRIGLSGIIQGYRNGCRNSYELAECLNVSEEFLCEALECYRQKYGRYTELDGYAIFFEPYLMVMERL